MNPKILCSKFSNQMYYIADTNVYTDNVNLKSLLSQYNLSIIEK